jgi:hypothetical protein
MKIIQGEQNRTHGGSPLKLGPEPTVRPDARGRLVGTAPEELIECREQRGHGQGLSELFGPAGGQRESHAGGRLGGLGQQRRPAHPRLAFDQQNATVASAPGAPQEIENQVLAMLPAMHGSLPRAVPSTAHLQPTQISM